MDVEVRTAEKLGRGPHILVVEDDPVLLDITIQLIELLGYSVTAATGSNEALAKLKENPDTFDVVFTDYGLPVIDGIELAKRIKEISCEISVILCSGKIDLIDESQIAAVGIAEVARKPYTISELDSIFKRVINWN